MRKKAVKATASSVEAMAEDAGNISDRRRIRNRMSQRAFRARQAMRIQELEERLRRTSEHDVAWTMQLQDQNAQLREQLLMVYKKATSMQISLKALANTAAQALGMDIEPRTSVTKDAGDVVPIRDSDSSTPEPLLSHATVDINRVRDPPQAFIAAAEADISGLPFTRWSDFATTAAPRNQSDHDLSTAAADGCSWPGINLDYMSNLSEDVQQHDEIADDRSLPSSHPRSTNVVDFAQISAPSLSLVPMSSYSLGPEHYLDLRERAATFCSDVQTIIKTNSLWSDHIDAFESCLASQRKQCGQILTVDKRFLTAIEFMINTFVNISWTQMTGWETHTKCLRALKDLTAWRMDRTFQEWERIVPQYRPTKLQMSVVHPSVIDWIPWPSLRDKLIIHHSANPRLDEIISHIGKAYVAQADLSTLVEYPQPIIGYVSVWGLVQAITAVDVVHAPHALSTRSSYIDSCGMETRPSTMATPSASVQQDNHHAAKLPASSADELFRSPSLAKAAHQLLRLDRGKAFNFRLDPSFFEAYPELYDSGTNIIARGVRLEPNSQFAVRPYPAPKVLDPLTVSQYRDFSKIALAYVAV